MPMRPVVNNSVGTFQKREVERQVIPYRNLVSQIFVYDCNPRDKPALIMDFMSLAADYPQHTSLIRHLLVGMDHAPSVATPRANSTVKSGGYAIKAYIMFLNDPSWVSTTRHVHIQPHREQCGVVRQVDRRTVSRANRQLQAVHLLEKDASSVYVKPIPITQVLAKQ